MALEKLKQPVSLKPGKNKKNSIARRDLPVKRSINLITAGEKGLNRKTIAAIIVLAVVVALAFGKFAVADRFIAAAEAEERVQNLQAQVEQGHAVIDSFGKIAEQYAHYTYAGMTEEELSLTDRMKIMELVDRRLLSQVRVNTWSINGNQLQAVISGSTLQRINEIVQELRSEDMVEYCSVTTAATGTEGSVVRSTDIVIAQITVYFNGSEGDR